MKKRKILLIDDDADFIRSVEMVLQAEGFAVITAHNGADGLDMAKNEQPDLIILDVMMDYNTEGFDTARKIRTESKIRHTPVILVTGIRREMNLPFSFEEDERYLPVTKVLEKPVNTGRLLETVKTMVEIENMTNIKKEDGIMDNEKKIKNVLIIDDDENFADTTKEVLNANGIGVVTAQNGTNGFEAAKEGGPDLILLDVMMEDAEAGLKTLRRLKADEKTADTPVFLITGIHKPQFLTESYAPGEKFGNVKKYFEKPVAPEKLLEAIETL